MKKGSVGTSGFHKQIPELDQLVNKFNNSLAIQNMGAYVGTQQYIANNNKSSDYCST